MEIFVEILIGIVFDTYLQVIRRTIPHTSEKKQRLLAGTISAFLLLTIISLLCWGLYELITVGNILGIIPLSISVAMLLAQTIASIILYIRHH